MHLPTAILLPLAALTFADPGDPANDILDADLAPRSASIYIAPVTARASAPPVLLAEIAYIDPFDAAAAYASPLASQQRQAGAAPAPTRAEVRAYEPPDLEALFPGLEEEGDEKGTRGGKKLVRVGVYDPKTAQWLSSTSVLSVANFEKGYRPCLKVRVAPPSTSPSSSSVSAEEDAEDARDIVSVALRGVLIDAGQTRDFGPLVEVVPVERGTKVSVGRPVVLKKDGTGTREGEGEEEKTFLQKYWWLIGIAVLVSLLGGGGDGK